MIGPFWCAFMFCGGVPMLWIAVGIACWLEPINAPWQAWQARIAWEDMRRAVEGSAA